MGDDGDDDDEPEEQEGSWVITHHSALGTKLEKRQMAAQAVDAAMRPSHTMAAWSVATSQTQRAELASFAVASAANLLGFTASGRVSLLMALLTHEASAPLVDLLLARLPALGPVALVAALEVEGDGAYRRLVGRTGLRLCEAAVEALLADDGQGTTRWVALLTDRAKQPLLAELVQTEPRLAAATFTSEAVAAASTPQSAPIALWLLESGAPVDGAALQERCHAGQLDEWLISGGGPFDGRVRATERRVGGRPVYRHVDQDRHIWFDGTTGVWVVTTATLIGRHLRRVTGGGVFAVNRHSPPDASPELFDRHWLLLPGGDIVRLRVCAVPPPPTRMHALVAHEASAPLVDLLLARLPALGPVALVAALEVEGDGAYRRLVGRTGLRLCEAAVEALLADDGQGTTRWVALLTDRAKQPLLAELVQTEPRLWLQSDQALEEEVGEEEGEEDEEEEEGEEVEDDDNDDDDDDDDDD